MAFSLKEIIDIAIGLEDSGYSFYLKCMAFFSNEKIKELFSFLAQEELNHKTIFQSMKDSDSKGLYNEEYYAYLHSISSGRIFAHEEDLDKIMTTIKTPEDAIQKGFNDEKESILFYNELKELYKDNDSTILLLDQIISEERKHVKLLLELKEMHILKN